jgi:hypothetical protein
MTAKQRVHGPCPLLAVWGSGIRIRLAPQQTPALTSIGAVVSLTGSSRRTPCVLNLSYRLGEDVRGCSQAVVGHTPIDGLGHALGMAVPGGNHIGGDACRAHQ